MTINRHKHTQHTLSGLCYMANFRSGCNYELSALCFFRKRGVSHLNVEGFSFCSSPQCNLIDLLSFFLACWLVFWESITQCTHATIKLEPTTHHQQKWQPNLTPTCLRALLQFQDRLGMKKQVAQCERENLVRQNCWQRIDTHICTVGTWFMWVPNHQHHDILTPKP